MKEQKTLPWRRFLLSAVIGGLLAFTFLVAYTSYQIRELEREVGELILEKERTMREAEDFLRWAEGLHTEEPEQ